jgi:cytochrome P450 family 135
VLGEVLLRYDVSLPEGALDHPRVRNITSVPRHGARIVVRPRITEESTGAASWTILGE